MLEIRSLSAQFGDRTIWRDVEATISSGSMTAVVGPSGSGKSTLLNCLGLLARPKAGTITFRGEVLTGLRGRQARIFRRDYLGYLFQNYGLIEDSTVQDNLRVALRAGRLRGDAAADAVRQALRSVGLADRHQERIAHLSGGEQQRVAMARLLVKRALLVLADEPTGALDQENADTVINLLRGLADTGAYVLIATHDAAVRKACDASIELP